MRRLRLFVACLAGVSAVSSGLGCSSAGGPTAAAPPVQAADPTLPDPSAPLDCGAGLLPSLERGACVAIGPTALGASFQKDSDGWRIHAARPAASCAIGSRAQLGAATCVPIDDGCDRAFPPADAAFVVTPGAVSSGKVVATLAEALALAKSGDLIALESGEHATFETATPLRLVGRCAARVVLKPMGTRVTGVWFTGKGSSSLESVTIQGARTALRAEPGADVTVNRVHFQGNSNGIQADGGTITAHGSVVFSGLAQNPGSIGLAATAGGTLEFDDGSMEDTALFVIASDDKSHITVKRSLLRGPGADSSALSSVMVAATAGGEVDVEESVLVTSQELVSSDAGPPPAGKKQSVPGSVHIARSELTQTGSAEIALSVSEAAALAIEDSSIAFHATVGIGVMTGQLSMKRSVVVGDGNGLDSQEVLDVSQQARATAEDSAFIGGLEVAHGIRGNGTSLTLTRSLVTGARFASKKGHGFEINDFATLTLDGSAVVDMEGTGILVGTDGVANLRSTLVDRARTHAGAEAWTGVAMTVDKASAIIDQSMIRRSEGPALSFSSGKALVKTSRLVDNLAGFLLRDPTSLVNVTDEPSDLVEGNVIVYETTLAGNGTDVADSAGDAPSTTK